MQNYFKQILKIPLFHGILSLKKIKLDVNEQCMNIYKQLYKNSFFHSIQKVNGIIYLLPVSQAGLCF